MGCQMQICFAIGIIIAASNLYASPPPPPSRAASETYYDPSKVADTDPSVTTSVGFETYHPDLRFRRLAVEARVQQRDGQAREFYLHAARYADKLSQGALAEMYWMGAGGDSDRALAYAWMDLAAERGAPLFLAFREKYWEQLSHPERERALREGTRLYADYGDAIAKPRLEKLLRKGRNQVTGSRVGWLGPNLKMYLPGEVGPRIAETYYAEHFWQPRQYWAWQDQMILTPEKSGDVKVGPAEQMRPQP